MKIISTVCVESLEIQKMMKKNKHHNLSGEIGDCGWGMFLGMLSRKCDQVLMIDTYFPSSQTCSVCGHIEKSVKNLNVRTWVCPVCGTVHDRDFNAAQNILREGLSLCGHKVVLSSTCPKIPSINSKSCYDSRGSIVRTIGVDFDNTIVIDEWPEIGALIPGAIETLKELQARGHRIILYTQRNDDYYMYCPELVEYGKKYGKSFKDTVDLLSPAVKLLSDEGISPDAINENPWWEAECQDYGRKVYFDVLIDDHNAGITRKTVKNSKGEWCEVVDWDALREWLKKEGIL